MIYDEGRAQKNGKNLPIECIRMTLLQPIKSTGILHYHDYTELLFGLQGAARVYIGTESTLLNPGELFVIPPGEVHNVYYESEFCEYIVIKFLPQLLFSIDQTDAEFGYALMLMEQSSDRQLIFSPEDLKKTDIPQLMQHMIEEWEHEEFGYELSLRADVMRVNLFLLRRWKKNQPWFLEKISPADRKAMQIALTYIAEHYADTNERDVAAACGVSPVILSRLFAQTMKRSFPSYVCGVRLREAERLLLTTDLSVTEIALQVGFSTSAYFIAKFRQAKGITPHQYRQTK